MFELPITKDCYKFLCLIYQEYLQRCDTAAKENAIYFDDIPDFVFEHLKEANCPSYKNELQEIGFISTDVLGGFELEDEAIIYMENRFKKGLSEVVSIIASL